MGFKGYSVEERNGNGGFLSRGLVNPRGTPARLSNGTPEGRMSSKLVKFAFTSEGFCERASGELGGAQFSHFYSAGKSMLVSTFVPVTANAARRTLRELPVSVKHGGPKLGFETWWEEQKGGCFCSRSTSLTRSERVDDSTRKQEAGSDALVVPASAPTPKVLFFLVVPLVARE